MQHNWSAFLERKLDLPEVQSTLKSIKTLTETKSDFLQRLSFEAEPANFGNFLKQKRIYNF